MSANDPNGTRWTNSEKNFGKNLLKKSGWTEGAGLGKSQEGVASHVKVSRKDDVMGLGYKAGVQDTWTTQSVGFADVLERIKTAVVGVGDDDDDNDKGEDDSNVEVSSPVSDTSSGRRHGESRHYRMYAKRNALRTELLRGNAEEKLEEILGSAASSKRVREGGDDNNDDAPGSGAPTRSGAHSKKQKLEAAASTLQSPLLTRLMMRCPKDEPRRTEDGDDVERVQVIKPNPRPPKCTDSPFLA